MQVPKVLGKREKRIYLEVEMYEFNFSKYFTLLFWKIKRIFPGQLLEYFGIQ